MPITPLMPHIDNNGYRRSYRTAPPPHPPDINHSVKFTATQSVGISPIGYRKGLPVKGRGWWVTGPEGTRRNANLRTLAQHPQLCAGGEILLGIGGYPWKRHEHINLSQWPLLVAVRRDLHGKHVFWSRLVWLNKETDAGLSKLMKCNTHQWRSNSITGQVWVTAAEIPTEKLDKIHPNVGLFARNKGVREAELIWRQRFGTGEEERWGGDGKRPGPTTQYIG